MGSERNQEGPVVLQLQRWDTSESHLDLSSFHEASISPTRKLLLLQSLERDALLLPLTPGKSLGVDSEVPSEAGFSNEGSSSQLNSCRFISDVNSLAWGICGGTYKKHQEASFRELLFVCGNHGVTAHAFCQPDENEKVSESPREAEKGNGRWMDWGPSTSCPDDVEAGGGKSNLGRRNDDEAGPSCSGNETSSDIPGNRYSRKWLRSFLTSVETKETNGITWTPFPDKTLFPRTAKVASFHIFSDDSLFLGFFSRGSVMHKRSGKENKLHESVGDPHDTEDLPSLKHDLDANVTAGMHSGYRCFKLFSGNCFKLIGFAFMPVSSAVNDSDSHGDECRGITVLISRLGAPGMQWICSVKLDSDKWTDFQFSNNLLVCLNASGLIFLYSAMTGKYVSRLDILETSGLKRQQYLRVKGKDFVNGGHDLHASASNNEKNTCHKFTDETGGFHDSKGFQKLLVAPHTSLLAAVDGHGAVYVVCLSDHFPEAYYPFERQPRQHLKFGALAPFILGNTDISCQKAGLTPTRPRSKNSDKSCKYLMDGCRNDDTVDDWSFYRRNTQTDFRSSGFVEIHKERNEKYPQSGRPLLLRNLFLPTSSAAVGDTVCFSSFGITRLAKRVGVDGRKYFRIVHANLLLQGNLHDDGPIIREETLIGEALGCISLGCFYLVTESGLAVVLPCVSVPSDFHPIESILYPSPRISQHPGLAVGEILKVKDPVQSSFPPWKVEILDRVLLYDGSDGADLLCLENGWDLKVSRLRRLQLALGYLNFDEIEQSLEKLAGINMAEEGILRLIFAAVYMMFSGPGSDNEISAAARLLALATVFATKMIREYALLEHKINNADVQHEGEKSHYLLTMSPHKEHDDKAHVRRLDETSHLLVVTRSLQRHIASKFSRPVQGSVDDDEASVMQTSRMSIDDSDTLLELRSNAAQKLALIPAESYDAAEHPDTNDIAQTFPVENPKEMIARWELDNLDLKNVVKDALLSGRLPLAVLQLHLHRSKDLGDDKDPNDTFTEIRDVGRAIAYDLFIKGETGLAVTTLQKLGEDVEACLRQLLFGTLDRLLRNQIAEEMKKYGYLRSYELAILDRLSLIERIYPSGKYWRTYHFRRKEVQGNSKAINSPVQNSLLLLHPHSFRNLILDCGEVGGVVLGSWTNLNGVPSQSEDDEDCDNAGYWASAAVWFNAWDQKTIDRILLDQPFVMGVHVMWESQLEYHICHNDWDEVVKLLDMIPSSLKPVRSLQISLDGLQSSSLGCSMEVPDYMSYMYSLDELDAAYAEIPNIRVFQSSSHLMCSTWLRMLLDKQLAKRLIFLKEYWDGTSDIISLMARAGFISGKSKIFFQDEPVIQSSDLDSTDLGGELQSNTLQALHKLVVHYSSQYDLPYLLDLYLDHHELALGSESLVLVQDAVGDCQWAKWLLFSRAKGLEYDASFCNARAIISRDVPPPSSLTALDVNDIIHTVDDIAENGWLMAALATLMFAPLSMENCLSSGSVNRRFSSSAQCTLENLRPALHSYPTLWRMLVAVCLGNDKAYDFWSPKVRTGLSFYLSWRDNVFYSSDHDVSLLQMLPCWFPKGLRRLIQLYVQGPLGWQALSNLPAEEAYLQRDIELLMNAGQYSEISAMSWEAAIQKQVEQELYASSVEETGLGLEHHLHRGRALAAFSHLLSYRVQKLKTESLNSGQPVASVRGQMNVRVDVQTLMAPLQQSEESLLSVVVPTAITNYQNSVLVASCAFLLETCGLSATMLRVDVAVLRRISDFYSTNLKSTEQTRLGLRDSTLHPASEEGAISDSLARTLADSYLQRENPSVHRQEGSSSTVYSGNISRVLMLVLQHLERASLPRMHDDMTCGSWLSSGNGDGSNLRSQQKAASQHWNLVTVFCRLHQIPLSTKYLALLAGDNDWVGFLSEAQVGGYPFDTVIQVAKREFKDLRLRTHILTVLRGLPSRGMVLSSSTSSTLQNKGDKFSTGQDFDVPVELFGILAECENQKKPGKALLNKAKQFSWSMLAIIASCFSDVTPLSCLTVWLEITAARDASLLKENDIASQIAKNVGAAVNALHSLSTNENLPTLHYNRKNPKRQRVFDPFSAPSALVSGYGAKASAEGMVERTDGEEVIDRINSDEWSIFLPQLLSVLCEQQQFLPLLRAFEMFLPSCSLLPFIRALQAFSQMRLSEAAAHLGSFSARIKEEPTVLSLDTSWISATASKAADAVLSNCPSPYEKRCLLQLLAATDFGDGGSAATCYRRQYWKINLAEPALRKNDGIQLGNNTLDDASLLIALEKNGQWEQARNWARQLEVSGQQFKFAAHHVTETQIFPDWTPKHKLWPFIPSDRRTFASSVHQGEFSSEIGLLSKSDAMGTAARESRAESMVAEWKEFLWDVQEERIALWSHCQTLFIRYSFPPLQAGSFFLKHAEVVEKDLPPREIHEMLLLSLQWLSGLITQSSPVYPLDLLREIETRVWLLAVESEALAKNESDLNMSSSSPEHMYAKSSNIVEKTASIVSKMDNHLNAMDDRASDNVDRKENNFMQPKSSQAYVKGTQVWDSGISTAASGVKSKRRAKAHGYSRSSAPDSNDGSTDLDDGSSPPSTFRNDSEDENLRTETSLSRWQERIGPAQLERAILSLLEFGQVTAARQLQHKLSPRNVPLEFKLVDAALKLAELSTPPQITSLSILDEDLCSVIHSYNILTEDQLVDTLQVLENLSSMVAEGSGRGLCKRIVAVVKAANVLDISFSEAFGKQPTELLQLLSLKAQDSFEEAKLLIRAHSLPATSIARILAESFLKGLLAAHRGGYIDLQKDEGPAPLLWRFSDFLKWAELCPSEPEMGHALMRLVITGQEIPHACEVELLILSHHFYKSSACLDGVDVLVALAATRVEAYVSEGDFTCMARLLTGVGNFHALNFILGILIENGQLDLLLQKYSAAADANSTAAEAGFRMALLTSLKHSNPDDHDAFAMVYKHFDMKHEAASLLDSQAEQSCQQWLFYDRDPNLLLEAMRHRVEAAEVHSSIDAGNKTRSACANASLLSLQIRIPDLVWIKLSDRNARSVLVNQSRFQEALIVAESYNLNQPSEWVPVLWNQMLKPELLELFVAEFVAVLPLQPSMLVELSKIYRSEVLARGDQPNFASWLGGGLPSEGPRQLYRSFRCLLIRTRDLRLRAQLASTATGFSDIINACNRELDKVLENAGPLVLRKGHGGAYLPLH